MVNQRIDEEGLERPYTPILDFTTWSDGQERSIELIDFALKSFRDASAQSAPDVLNRTIQDVVHAAALETGSIEGLYKQTTGVTLSLIQGVVSAAGAMEAATEGHEDTTRLIEGQRVAYDLAFDAATGKRPLSETLIREVHETACAGQAKHRVLTDLGWQTHPLSKGAYKTNPNNVRQPDDTIHAYCPVSDVAPEMETLIANTRGAEFEAANPVLQAAYLHHAFTHIHPFADGNGRTARVLASIPLITAYSVPLVVLADRDAEYRQSQAQADQGNTAAFVSLIEEMVVDLLQLLAVRLDDKRVDNSSEHITDRLTDRLHDHVSSHDSRGQGAERLVALVAAEVDRAIETLVLPEEISRRTSAGSGSGVAPNGYLTGSALYLAELAIAGARPTVRVRCAFKISVSNLSEERRPLVVTSGNDHLYCRVNEVFPRPTQSFRLILEAWIRSRISILPDELLRLLDNLEDASQPEN